VVGAPIYYLITPQGGDGLVELAWTITGGVDPVTTELSVLSGPAPHVTVYTTTGRQGNFTYKFSAHGQYEFQVGASDGARSSAVATYTIVL
jgi:hypothetical protein